MGLALLCHNGSGLKFGQATECIHFSLTVASRSLDPRSLFPILVASTRSVIEIRAQAGAINTRLNPKGLQFIGYLFNDITVILNSI